MREIVLTRHGVVFEDAFVGPVLELPRRPAGGDFARVPGGLGGLSTVEQIASALGLHRELAAVGRVEGIRLFGLHEPDPWERALVSWTASVLRVGDPMQAPPHSTQPGPFCDFAGLLADPLAVWPKVPPAGAHAVEGEDPGLEALGVVRFLRRLVLDRPEAERLAWLDDVLVLVPDDAPRLALWRDQLERAGLPVRTRVWSRLAESAPGRWVSALLDLHAGEARPVRRASLHAVFDAPLYRLPEGARRADLRSILRELRRSSLTLDALRSHAAAWFDRRLRALDPSEDDHAESLQALQARRDGALQVIDAVKAAVGASDASGLWLRVRRLLGADGFGMVARIAATGDADLRAAAAAVQALVEELAAAPANDPSPRAQWANALASRGRGERSRPSHGVRLQTWSAWDGRGAGTVVLAGLEDGGWPRAPAPMDARAIGTAELRPLADASDELARQARVTATAAAACRQVLLLSWSRSAQDGGATWPGPVLAGLPRESWLAAGALSSIQERHIAAEPGDASLPEDVRSLPYRCGIDDPRWSAAEEAATHARRIAAVRAPTEARAPGPWTGDLGASIPERTWSPTALEDLGQCGTKFFLARLMRAERDTDADAWLDSMEAGSLVHAAMATAALRAIEAEGCWDLQSGDPGAPPASVSAGLAHAADSLAADHPTLGPGVARVTLARWQRALLGALVKEADAHRGGLFAQWDGALSSLTPEQWESVAQVNKDAAAAVARWQQTRRALPRTEALITSLSTQPPRTKKEAGQRYADAGSGLILGKGEVESACRNGACDGFELLRALTGALDAADARVMPFVEKARHTDRLAVARQVRAAEWSFGAPAGEGPADPRSTSAPLSIDLPGGGTISLKGRVDRIDGDVRTGAMAVVDYKTGRAKSGPALARALGRGLHLQLPIYGEAASSLLARVLEWPAPAHVEAGRLQFPRTGKESSVDLAGARFVEREGGPSIAAPDLLRAHLGHSAGRLRRGVLPLLPRACPLFKDRDAYCDFEAHCGLDPESVPLVEASPQPNFSIPVAPPKSSSSPKKVKPTSFVTLRPTEEPPDSASAREGYDRAMLTILDLERDVVVSAGAGSGKTTALVERYVRALVGGCDPNEILAITFTRKATAELRHRVRERLLSPACGLPDERRRAALLALGAAPILTIDAFAARVVTTLGADSVAVGDTDAFVDDWLDARLVEACEDPSPDLKRLLRRVPLPEVRQQLRRLLDAPAEQLGALAALEATDVVARWTKAFDRAMPDLVEARGDAEGFAARVSAAWDLADSADRNAERKAFEAAAGSLSEAAAMGTVPFLGALYAAARGAKTWDASAELASLRERLGTWKRRWVNSGTPTRGLARSAEDWGTVAALLVEEADDALAAVRIAVEWREDVARTRKQARLFGFEDILAEAAALLRRAAAGDGGALADTLGVMLPLRHAFVDEFQDTNQAQVELLDALLAAVSRSRPTPRLFLVGDVKQSIYRFRGAEVDVFERELSRPGRARTTLDVCRRARPALCRSLDRLFERVLAPRFDDGTPADPLGEVPWQPLAPRWNGEDSNAMDDGPCVDLVAAAWTPGGAEGENAEDGAGADEDGRADDAPSDDGEAGAEAEAVPDDAIVQHIRSLRAEHEGWTIALLTHSWRQAEAWGAALQNAGVPVWVQGGRGLLRAPAVAPLLTALQALEREDDFGVLAVLRGPLVGLSDAGLWAIRNGAGVRIQEEVAVARTTRLSRLRRGFRFDAAEACAWVAAQGATPSRELRSALEIDAQRVTAWSPWWGELARRFGLESVRSTLQRMVDGSGWIRALYGDGGGDRRVALAALRRFLDHVGALDNSVEGGPLAVVRELARQGADEDPPAGSNPHEGPSVTVTVVHQAKGLAWDVVVVPNPGAAGSRSRADEGAPVRILDEDGHEVLLPSVRREAAGDPFAVVRGLSGMLTTGAAEPWERAERRRTLYVACTRARKRLVLGGLPHDVEDLGATMVRLGKRNPDGAFGPRNAGTWLEDLLCALRPRVGDGDRVVMDEGCWVEGRDYRWVRPDAVPRLGESAPSDKSASSAEGLARGLWSADVAEIVVTNPSALRGGPVPTPLPSEPPRPGPVIPDWPGVEARLAGTILHAALAAWAWRGDWEDAVAREVILALHPHGEGACAVGVPWVRALVLGAEARQPELGAALRRAAARGDVFHEVRVQVPHAAGRVEGSIDLLWRDDAGDWHLLDYKATERDGGVDGSLEERVATYHPQVRAYAAAIDGWLPDGGRLTTYGLWFVREGVVVGWKATDSRGVGR